MREYSRKLPKTQAENQASQSHAHKSSKETVLSSVVVHGNKCHHTATLSNNGATLEWQELYKSPEYVKNLKTQTRRRLVFLTLTSLSLVFLVAFMGMTLFSSGFLLSKLALFICFCISLPWLVFGFWNTFLGFLLLRLPQKKLEKIVYTGASCSTIKVAGEGLEKEKHQTLLVSCIRNEDCNSVAAKLDAMLEDLHRQKQLSKIALAILSDSSEPVIIENEAVMLQELKGKWQSQLPITYRRRTENTGFKAGNIAQFVKQYGHLYTYMIPLDADSYMSASSICSLIEKMDADPKLGILQGLVIARPAPTAFARIFQWSMRIGMRLHTIGAAWWLGDNGPYWGHNAIIRIKPFTKYCLLSPVNVRGPLGGAILSHDLLEAKLMHAAGYDVRVWPFETTSYEENPVNLSEFLKRDLRWCHGNLQYFLLLGESKLNALSRLQLVMAILMYVSSPAWLGFVAIATITGIWQIHTKSGGVTYFDPQLGPKLLIIMMCVVMSPKLLGLIDCLLTKQRRNQMGGMLALLYSAVSELLLSVLISPILAFSHTKFMIGLFTIGKKKWARQHRGNHQMTWGQSYRLMKLHTLWGVLGLVVMIAYGFSSLWLLSFVVIGPLIAIPYAVYSSGPLLSAKTRNLKLWCIPEESDPGETLSHLRARENRGKAE
ncbi:glucans biosynthesis glucosyltransferase MdoH [Polycladidibacter stylochi]|uniref:glucans biosynthesis glucosyltransferase MdoH n=1 Tax=Polycladidibacter stylochi TaxID=1807766 RepID=UPI00082EBFEC|nr:glucans biosynthesis glucosyltransferase MdoH [Pseudovibrio stylochi]